MMNDEVSEFKSETTKLMGQNNHRFNSLNKMREAHNQLLRNGEADTEKVSIDEVLGFIGMGVQTGAILDSFEDRLGAQSMLDYWHNFLLRRKKHANIDTLLTNFDEEQLPELDDAACPYVGLDAFREPENLYFFGREQFVQDLIHHLENSRILALIGPSGSGKSSVISAGLIPALKSGAIEGSENWRYVPRITPGEHPFANLAMAIKPHSPDNLVVWLETNKLQLRENSQHLLNLLEQQGDKPALIFIDQFEELFSLAVDTNEQRAFIASIQELVSDQNKDHKLVLTMRGDFRESLEQFREFSKLLKESMKRIPPLNSQELRQAIVKPAALANLNIDKQVVDNLIQEVLWDASALPLLQFTLLKLWENRVRNRISEDVYRELGGVYKVLVNTADELYASLTIEEQRVAKHIFLRLIQINERLNIVNRRVLAAKFFSKEMDATLVDNVVRKLVDARLVREIGSIPKQIEIAHEAFGRVWPKMQVWIEEKQERLQHRLHLKTDALQWDRLERDPGALRRGRLLQEALGYTDLDTLEQFYVTISQKHEEDERAKREAAKQTELELRESLENALESQKEEEQRRMTAQAHIDAQNKRINKKLRRITLLTIVSLVTTILIIADLLEVLGINNQSLTLILISIQLILILLIYFTARRFK